MRRILAAIVLVASTAGGAGAQAPATSSDSAQDASKPFLTRTDAWLAAGFALGTVAMLPVDQRLAQEIREPVFQDNTVAHDAASFFRFMGQPAPEIIGPSLYLAGRLGGWPYLSALGLHGTESFLLATVFTTSIKMLAGRARPYVSADSAAYSFKLFRGFKGTDYSSFPSGHTTTAFSVASAVTAETAVWLDREDAWPGWKLVVGGVMYGGATLVGISRMYHDKHWASDVVVGAAIGTFSGNKVVWYAYSHPDNRVDRILLSTTVLPSPRGGMTVAWSLPAPF